MTKRDDERAKIWEEHLAKERAEARAEKYSFEIDDLAYDTLAEEISEAAHKDQRAFEGAKQSEIAHMMGESLKGKTQLEQVKIMARLLAEAKRKRGL